MEWVFFAVFSVLAALVFNFVNPKIMAMSWAQTPNASSFIGRTLVTAASFFVVLAVAGVLMSLVTGKAERLPAA
jgi:protein-S-isoprenylcysteine O-methyltransferase Ste14